MIFMSNFRCMQFSKMYPMLSLSSFQLGASINAQNKKGNSPLHEATKWNKEGCVLVLIEANANLHSLNKLGQTPLQTTQVNTNQHFPHHSELIIGCHPGNA